MEIPNDINTKLTTEKGKRRHFEPLPSREGFPFLYEKAEPDRNALFVLNKHLGKGPVAATRTKYHRAILTFDALHNDLLEFDIDRPPRCHQPSYYAAVASVRDDLGITPGSIIPLTTGAVAKHPQLPLSKSPGLPYKLQGYHTKGEALQDPSVLKRIRQTWYDVEANKPIELPDTCCFARSQICPRDKNKVRATWGYPLDVYMAEAQSFYPYLDALKNTKHPIIAYGLEMANGGMSYIDTMIRHFPRQPILLGDWSRFDKTIPPWLIRDAFRIVEEAIDFSHVKDSEGRIWPVRPHRSRRRWRRIVDYFINTPVRMSDGRRYLKKGGVPSGSCWTNVIDSIINAIVMRYLTYEATGQLPQADCYLGDDSVVVMPAAINLTDFADQALKEFGMILNLEKSNLTTDPSQVHFLGYYNASGYPRRDIDPIVASTIYPERTVLTKLDTITRLLGQAYSCFDPYYATKFLICAKELQNEENLSDEALEDYIHRNPARFKFLQTIGIDPKQITMPMLDDRADTMRTMPGPNLRSWNPKYRCAEDLYIIGIQWFSDQLELESEDMGDTDYG